ncbi:radical SAM superfamily enzyme [Desulfosporosinus orientis DSM 765]|uniref:FeMo cofactor biosynthesis protein NifB n=1 Tax=Desulfosporosinus orientis (strain ATCC 19365 / DSM 765 / NCIMB 8382 / VKM B-1628 / Singapore I) TaxID=768706 RepID=G7WJH4_DESOD|nr:radical SAM protein [Desulfosporosinus orientis]AET70411.1 radical SAM superfamily enzyme [Desulfosporosinus orientis DSM 765]
MHRECEYANIAEVTDTHLNHGHPCFSTSGHGKNGRIHLAVAPECNISCNYCVRKFDCANESRPGVTSKVITPDEAIETVLKAKASVIGSKLKVVGIAGPGDPLANEATFETLRKVKENFPEMILCMSTNGLLLPERLPELVDIGVSHITVTINTLDEKVGAKIYSHVRWQGKTLKGNNGARILIRNQLLGLEQASKAGMTVKVNTVVIPGVNEKLLYSLALDVKKRGAHLHNLLPLIPQGKLAHKMAPPMELIKNYRSVLSSVLPQMTHCQQCRADAIGLV